MSTSGRIILVATLALVVLLAIAVTFTVGWRPVLGPKTRPLTGKKFEVTPQRLQRGQYIFNSLAICVDCHSEHDSSQKDHPVLANMVGSGEVMPLDNLPGRIVAPNLTSDRQTGAGSWTDDQLARAIREGIGHDGRALFPIMPYERYRHMSDEDLASVVVYIRTLPPVSHALPATEIIFPVKYLIRAVPEPITDGVSAPSQSTRVQYGAYLINMAACADCHTPMDKGQPIAGLDFAGGQVFQGKWGHTVSANITPDPSGINYYDENLFIQVMRTGYVKARKLDALMPVEQFQGLTDDDLKAIFAYLKTLNPVRHRIDNSQPPTFCKLCRSLHGAGDQN
jgi:Cytochrome c